MRRLAFVLIAVFWISMNVLLWRAEWGGGHALGGPVPVEMVWDKILTAPDSSTMDILLDGKKIGYCRWIPNISEAPADNRSGMDAPIEGMVRQVSGYTIDLEGNALVPDSANRVHWLSHTTLNTNKQWQEFTMNVTWRPVVWEVTASALRKTVDLKYKNNEGTWGRVFTFEDLSKPETLLQTLGLPGGLGLLGIPPGAAAPSGANASQPSSWSLGLHWEARNDTMKLGHSAVRVHRLEARVLDRQRITIMVSRVGELLRIDLPGGLVLLNDSMLTY